MAPLPTVIMTDVIRSAHQGDSHGGIYIVNLETESWNCVYDWNDQRIEWTGRGHDRGLRGIGFHGEYVWIAASDEIFVFDREMRIIRSHRNRYLKHCHEICVDGDRLFAASTGHDSVLEFDLQNERWIRGYCLRGFPLSSPGSGGSAPIMQVRFAVFDPNKPGGPSHQDTVHLNMVSRRGGALFVCGVGLDRVMRIEGGTANVFAKVPTWTHNCQPFGQGLIMNSTQANAIIYQDHDGRVIQSFPIKQYPEEDLLSAGLPRDYARQGFGRGLALGEDGLVIGGSSPGTISVYRLGQPEPIKTINLTMDVRNSPHGLEIWPFGP